MNMFREGIAGSVGVTFQDGGEFAQGTAAFFGIRSFGNAVLKRIVDNFFQEEF